MTMLLSGREVAAALNDTLQARAAALRAKGVEPTLAVVRVGERPNDVAYERGALKRCEKVGVATRRYLLSETASQAALLDVLHEVNEDDAIHGCLLFRPLPAQFDEETVRNVLAPRKDVDGITDASLAGVFAGTQTGFPPCTAQACMEILDHYHVDPTGKRAVVIGRSLVIGRPVAMLLLRRNATVTVCHTRTADLPATARNAELLIVAAGREGVVNRDCFAEGQTVIDVGIHVDATGKLTGDVPFAEAEPVVSAVTPVPGGVGAVTTSVLVKHVLLAAERAAGSRG